MLAELVAHFLIDNATINVRSNRQNAFLNIRGRLMKTDKHNAELQVNENIDGQSSQVVEIESLVLLTFTLYFCVKYLWVFIFIVFST